MKTKIPALFALFIFAFSASHAQSQYPVSKRVNITLDKIAKPLKLDASQISRTDSVFAAFYNAQNKVFLASKGSTPQAREQAFEKILRERDAGLKIIFTNDQYTKFKTKVEDSLRPQFQSPEGR